MTTALWCLVIVAFIPLVLAGVGGYLRLQQLGKVDNKHPRTQALELTGPAARAVAAQANAWEATALFTVSVVIAHLAGADEGAAATAAMVFVAARVLHAGLYIANLDIIRSLVFLVGVICCVRLLWLAAAA